jgi:hypothetical protein
MTTTQHKQALTVVLTPSTQQHGWSAEVLPRAGQVLTNDELPVEALIQATRDMARHAATVLYSRRLLGRMKDSKVCSHDEVLQQFDVFARIVRQEIFDAVDQIQID